MTQNLAGVVNDIFRTTKQSANTKKSTKEKKKKKKTEYLLFIKLPKSHPTSLTTV